MVKFIAANAADGEKDPAKLQAMSFAELQTRFREVAAVAIGEDKAIHALLREQLPVYAAADAKA